jgi:hypothetical protein
MIDEISDNGVVFDDGSSMTFAQIVELMNALNQNYSSPEAVSMPRSLQRILDGMEITYKPEPVYSVTIILNDVAHKDRVQEIIARNNMQGHITHSEPSRLHLIVSGKAEQRMLSVDVMKMIDDVTIEFDDNACTITI